MELSIIIVNYNGKHYLEDCIKSISKFCTVTHEIIIVDNLSTDGSQLFIKEKFPSVVLIENSENAGFAKANNIGAQKAKGKNILLLNNDTILMNEIDSLLAKLDRKEVGAIGIKMLNGDKEYTHSVGRFPTPIGLLKLTSLNEKRPDIVTGNFTKDEYEVDWIGGSFVLITKENWDKVGGLDEDYFMYVEDVDFCKKLQKEGKQILFCSNYSYIHFVGFNPSRELKLINGYKIYSSKHFSFVNATLAKISLTINHVYKRAFKNIR
ncbi:glycosyltransferase family 2 protein [Pseudotenacibaculum haliotis]|uniref:Glycosyltransferase family 2 protein n=1 Tax=Pseudotenacibaculum haliotis TaxID=1862138 RepID=A0ABW5LR93_9FLAO